ncbi:hypothetical protein B0H11DRAFT_1707133 [Mycena galericulata]|nr:hypothetical protein B0H11DRAFT_1707133 [Mycena galericulata]
MVTSKPWSRLPFSWCHSRLDVLLCLLGDNSIETLFGRSFPFSKWGNGSKRLRASRLYRIIISESLYMIWKIRCDCVIGKGGQSLSNSEIHNKWLHAINERLKFDCILTNHSRYGKNVSIKPILVLQTWSSTLKNEEDLPENWLKEPKVLVGIEPMRSPPPSQPADRPGRNR